MYSDFLLLFCMFFGAISLQIVCGLLEFLWSSSEQFSVCSLKKKAILDQYIIMTYYSKSTFESSFF